MIRHLIIIFGLLYVVDTYSQTYDKSYFRNDLNISVGIPTIDIFSSVKSDELDKYFPDDRYLSDNFSGIGIIGLSYTRSSRNTRFLFGGSVLYNSYSTDVFYLGSYEGLLKRNFVSILIEGIYRYQNLNKIQLYSGLGLGYNFGSEKLSPPEGSGKEEVTGNINRLAYQVVAIGMRYGRGLGVFVELGYGYNGIVNAGLSYQF